MQKKKFSKKWGLLFSLNFIIGYAFTVGIGQAFATSGAIGFPIILIICALVAYSTGTAFSTLSAKYHCYGGSYQYVKRGIGNKASFLIGWFQYVQGPFVAMSTLAGIVWAFSSGNFFGWDLSNQNDFNKAKPYLFIFTTVLFIFLIVVVNMGFNSTKIALFITWSLKWLILLLSLFLAMALIIKLGATGQGHKIISNFKVEGFKMQGPFLSNLITSVLTFFFAFGGFEGVAAISNDIENPKKNMRFIISATIIIATVFYLFYYFIFLGALGAAGNNPNSLVPMHNGKPQWDANPMNLVINQLFGVGTGLTIAISGIIILSQIANKSSSRIMNPWVNAKLVLPLAIDGWLPKWFTHVNKYGQFNRCLMFDSVFTGILLLIYAMGSIFATDTIANNLAATFGIYSLVAFVNYIGVIIALFNLHRKKELSLSKWQIVYTTFALISLVLIFVGFFSQGIYFAATSSTSTDNANAFNAFIFQFVGFGIATLVGLVIAICSKVFKWKDQKLHPTFIKYVKVNPDSIDEELINTINKLDSTKTPTIELVHT